MTSLPQWSADFGGELAAVRSLPITELRDWALGGATGGGVRVAVVDSGIDATHPRVGGVAGWATVVSDADDPEQHRVVEEPHDDLVGHGTACAGIIRTLAPDVELWSVRVLGENLRTRGTRFLAGLRWALDNGMHVANLSLSSRSDLLYGPLHAVCDDAYFMGVPLVCAANNVPGPTYPAQYSSVISVAAREGADPWALASNPHPPVEFGATGVDVDVAWAGGGSIVATGNSFAAAHVTGMVAGMLGTHPWLTPFQVKTVLQALAENATAG
ncbi:S8 family serine peptidase [Nostocoides sp. F2B08]|uniref:S8 family serine peptidase n=1 Tax=Nostocoides sp. F2B08 TaxID=2653936 RepID=UPI00186AE4E5|nr:S8 family serine peptidase [Tetrasphaera sp. F2B08]